MRGFWHILEAVIAGMIIMLFLLTLVRQPTGEQPRDLAPRAFQLLHGLEKQEGLREFAEANDVTGLLNAIRYAAANRTVQICDYNGACAGSQPNATQRWSAVYILAGRSNYTPREVRLFLANR